MPEIELLHEDEKKFIKESASFLKFAEAHPEASVEDFVLSRIKASKAFAFASKYNKGIDPAAYFSGLKEITRRQMLEEWTNNPDITELTPPEKKSSDIHEDKTSNPDPKPEIFHDSSPKKKSEQMFGFEKNENFSALAENIPSLKKGLENSSLDGLDESSDEFKKNFAQRQKIADYISFMESGKKSQEAIQQKDWKFLEREYRFFPKIPTDVLFKIYNKHLERHKNPDNERTEMLQRVIRYRLENIKNGKQKIADENELKSISDFISAEKSRYPDFAQSIDEILQDITTDYQKSKAEKEKEAEDKRLEKERLAKEAAEKKQEEERLKTETENQETEEPVIVINQGKPLSEPSQNKNEEPEKEVPKTSQNNTETDKKTSEDKPKETEKGTSQETLLPPFNWREETKKDWQEYAEKHEKKAEITDTPEKVIVKIFANEEKAKVNVSEAAITYDGPNKVTLSGYNEEIPDLSIFENLIASSKKIGSKIKFGEIRDADFSAKLMIACLRNPDVEMVNAPKIEDLKGLSPKVKEILDFELENKGKKRPCQTGLEKSKEVREKLHAKSSPDEEKTHENRPRKPKRQYTKEETEAYLKRKKLREAQNAK